MAKKASKAKAKAKVKASEPEVEIVAAEPVDERTALEKALDHHKDDKKKYKYKSHTEGAIIDGKKLEVGDIVSLTAVEALQHQSHGLRLSLHEK